MVFTASQPFTSKLIMSNPDGFKYCWVWNKTRATGFANAKKQPLRDVEDIVVFSNGGGKTPYYPQDLVRISKVMKNSGSCGGDTVRGVTEESRGKGSLRTGGKEYTQEFTNYPRQLLKFNSESKTKHPTQKPLAIMEYLIKTYTRGGETVLDFTMGSGTTGVACKNLNRNFIGIELDPEYFRIAKERIESA
jgi:site-specific DNA-methyltransferase (adenine-specific)